MSDKFQILKDMAREYNPNDMSLEEYTVKLANDYSKVCKNNYKLQQQRDLYKNVIDKILDYVNSDEFEQLFESYSNFNEANCNINHFVKENE